MHIKELKVKDVWNLIKDFELHNETVGWDRFDGKKLKSTGIVEWINKNLS